MGGVKGGSHEYILQGLDKYCIKGGAINCGLLIAGPPPAPLGGCEGQGEQNLLSGGPSESVNVGARGGGGWWPSIAMNYRLMPTHCSELLTGENHLKICVSLIASRSLVSR